MGRYCNLLMRCLLLDLIIIHSTLHYAKGLLQCACTTADCRTEGAVRCVASSMCYVQFLDRGDGASPWSRGCIDGIANSLLCENQPPAALSASYGKGRKGRRKLGGRGSGLEAGPPILWPLIHCCSTSFCNSEEFSASYPVWMKKKLGMNSTSGFDSNRQGYWKENSHGPNSLANHDDERDHRENDVSNEDRGRIFESEDYDSYSYNQPTVLTLPESGYRSINPIYVAVPAVGACLLVVIVVFAFYLLRKHGSAGTVGGPASTPSLLSSSPFIYADRLSHSGGQPDCVCCESSSSSSSLYCHHDERLRDNRTYHQKHPPPNPDPRNQKLHPPKYAEAFLSPPSHCIEVTHPHAPPPFLYPPNTRHPKTTHVSDPTLFSSPPPQPPPAYFGTSMAPFPDDTPPAYLGASAPLPRDSSPSFGGAPAPVLRGGSPPSYVPRALVATADKDQVQSLLL